MLAVSLIIVAMTCLTLLIRRKMSRFYILGEDIGGPPGCPVLGHVLLFLKKEFLDAMMEMDALYYGIARFWFGHKLVVGINDPDLYEMVLSNKSALDKGDFYHFLRPLFGNGLIAADSKIWQVNRRIVAPTLNTLKIKQFTEIFVHGSENLALSWRGKVGIKFEPYADVSKTAFGFTMRTALGKTGNWSDTQLEEMVALVNQISAGVAYRFIRPWLYPEWIFNLTPTGKQVNSDTLLFRKFLSGMIAMKSSSSDEQLEENNGFISHILGISKINPEFTDGAILDELSTYMTAGFETVSTAIAFTLVMLGCHPELQEKVYSEQMNVVRVNSAIDWDDLCRMEYLEMFVKETMRLFPAITIIGRQLSADIVVGKKLLPKGAFALIPVYAIHRNPIIWDNPDVFNPDRFLPVGEKARHHQAFLPFGAGPRVCMGQKYAMVSMKAMLSSVVRRFRITTDYKMKDIKLSKKVTLDTRGLHLTLELRT